MDLSRFTMPRFGRVARSAGSSSCTLLRSIAGCPAGLRETRRGSFLVLVVGTLALMSVFAIVYIAIGRADLGTSSGVKRNAERDDVPKQMADYIGGVIAADATAMYVDGRDGLTGAGGPIYRREDTDFPGTPWEVTSIKNPTSDRTLDFRPAGTALSSEYSSYNNVAANLYAQRDRHLPSDPWLASLTPTWLNFDGIAPTNANRQYLDYKDWAQISNVAPDGAFVNLKNLRGNFAAPAQAMRVGLNLIEDDGTPDTDTDFGSPMRSVNVSLLGKSYAVASHPADTTMRQRGAFRLATDINFVPGNPEFALNQWADADGDGFLDARWFELTDARDPIKPKGLLKTNGKHRYFFAARIVDLSGLVNVTTATDTAGTPTKDGPIGATPADVDLRRLLTMQDFRDQFNNVGYDTIPQTTGLRSSDNYSQYDAAGTLIGGRAYQALYATGDQGSGTPPANRGAAISGLIPPKPTGGAAAPQFYFGNSNFWKFGDPYATFVASAVKDRGSLYRQLAANSLGVSQYDVTTGSGTSLADGLLVSIIGSPDLEDLLTYRGLNDPEISSNLELIFDGRHLGGGLSLSDRYGPMRSNRGLEVEREKLDVATPFGVADPAAMLQAATSVRQYVTTLSGARPIRSTRLNILPETNASNIANNARVASTLTTGELKIKISTDAASLYKGYAAALIPDAHPANATLGLDDFWPATPPTDAAFDKVKQLNYGATTPELGAIMSAHLAANMAAALGSQNESVNSKGGLVVNVKDPKPYTVILSNDQRATIASKAWAFDKEKLLDLGEDRLAAAKTQVVSADGMNVYGIVPEPTITAMGVFHVYTITTGATLPVIDGTISGSNDDFVGQVLAFQLTNPFNEDISAGSGGHYLEYAGRKYTIKASDLPKGETKTFYIFSGKLSNKAKFTAWFTQQLGPNLIEIREGNTSSLGTDDLVGKMGTSADPSHPKSFDVVRLWRVLDPGKVAKDQLVDRFRVPFEAGKSTTPEEDWHRLLPGPNTVGVDVGNTIDYTGGSITIGGVFRRPGDTPPAGGAGIALERGAPAFMIERKYTSGFAKRLNLAGYSRTSLAAGDLAYTDFLDDATNYYGARTLDALFTKQDAASIFDPSLDWNTWLTTAPKDWDVSPTIDQESSNQISGASFDSLRTEILRWSLLPKETKVLDVVRVGDMLMPLAVGPEFTPFKNPNPTGEEFENQYTTLGEALGMALGYDRPSAGGVTEAEKNAFKLLTDKFGGHQRVDAGGAAAAGSNTFALVDRGHLRLDAFAPFFDDGTLYNGSNFSAISDFRRGAAVPIAFNVLSIFTPYDPQLDRSIVGQVNLNTAPLPVMRTLPMLTPPADASLPTGSTWWFASHGNTGAASSDVAAATVAYRDKSIVNPRNGGAAIPFNDSIPTTTPRDFDKLDGRSFSNGIDGVREFPGFASVGELMAVRGAVPAGPNNIDYLGYKTGVTVPDDGVRSGDTSKIPNGPYADKLLIASAVSNSASVRSDVFAVWFVVAGFAKTDLVRGDGTALKPEDPMVPSVQRRFVMVVDRSNVTQQGQKPRVVLFKEVPL